MAFTPLAVRLSTQSLPLIICGPILRHVTADSVSVWVALKANKHIGLQVLLDNGPAGEGNHSLMQEGFGETISLGDKLHIVSITATSKTAGQQLVFGQTYFYNLYFSDQALSNISSLEENLLSEGVLDFDIYYPYPDEFGFDNPSAGLSHPGLPSFTLPPGEPEELRLVHGSCRMPHAEGLDALPVIDDMLHQDWSDPTRRPHLLLFTGDQIYADDVSPIFLSLLMDAAPTILGWEEELPEACLPDSEKEKEKEKQQWAGCSPSLASLQNGEWTLGNLSPTQRKAALKHGGYTSSDLDDHVMTFGEYSAMYLFAWSNVFWPEEFPSFESIYVGKGKSVPIGDSKENMNSKSFQKYQNHEKGLKAFRDSLKKVRRAMANIPIYMIFDDHDVTDDWNMTYDWCERTMNNPLGRRLVLNGLLSYSIFQAWGNTPDRFAEIGANGKKTSGKSLLEAAEQWRALPSDTATETTLATLLGLPVAKNNDGYIIFKSGQQDQVLNQDASAIQWNYTLAFKNYEIIFLDARTLRGYPNHDGSKAKKIQHPDIISERFIEQQLQRSKNDTTARKVTFIVAPTSVISIPAVDLGEFPWIVRKLAQGKFKKNRYEFDIFDHWRNRSKATERLLAAIAARAQKTGQSKNRNIILTGDVHFSAASRMQYQARQLYQQSTSSDQTDSVFAQLASSAFKKQDIKTRLLHYRGYKFGNIAALGRSGAFLNKIPGEIPTWVYAIAGIIVGPLLLIFHVIFALLDKILEVLENIFPFGLFEEQLPDPVQYFGWSDPAAVGSQTLVTKIEPILPDTPPSFGTIKLDSPAMISLEDSQIVHEFQLPDPHWRYRVDFILAEDEVRNAAPEKPGILPAPSPGDRKEALQQYLSLSKNHYKYARKWGHGKEIVGVNNVSEVSFEWTADHKTVIQESWWRLDAMEKNPLPPFPLTKFKVSLDFNDDRYQLPQLPNQTPNEA